jgi:hypothetical protein
VGLAKKLVGAAVGAVSATGAVVRHVAWYVSYRVGGKAKKAPED